MPSSSGSGSLARLGWLDPDNEGGVLLQNGGNDDARWYRVSPRPRRLKYSPPQLRLQDLRHSLGRLKMLVL